MRNLLWALLLLMAMSLQTGCIIPAYSGDSKIRARELIVTSENLRMVLEEWQRFWFLDQPSHMTPFRTHGGIF
ncbi:MAG: hypothetical protein MK179_07110 [Pirellulaceae bacterium]|nr:hypothetical protein [Pirellulaceae bacterium]